MAVVVPLVAAAFTGAAGVAAIGAATTTLGLLSGYAMVAGAVLTGVGALTGKNDLMKAGGILSLAGGLGNLAASSTAAGSAAASATPGIDAAGSALVDASASPLLDAAAGQATAAAGSLGPVSFDAASAMGATGGFGGNAAAGAFGDAFGTASLGFGNSAIQQAASGLTSSDIGSFMKRAANKVGEVGKNVGPWIKENKELVQLAGGALDSMYGPEAEAMNLRKRMFNEEKRLMDRAYANLNNPVKLYNYGGRG